MFYKITVPSIIKTVEFNFNTFLLYDHEIAQFNYKKFGMILICGVSSNSFYNVNVDNILLHE